MRISTVLLAFSLGLGAAWVLHSPLALAQRGGQGGGGMQGAGGQRQPGGNQQGVQPGGQGNQQTRQGGQPAATAQPARQGNPQTTGGAVQTQPARPGNPQTTGGAAQAQPARPGNPQVAGGAVQTQPARPGTPQVAGGTGNQPGVTPGNAGTIQRTNPNQNPPQTPNAAAGRTPGGRTQQQPAGPLVPAFGEQQPADMPIAPFGSRDGTASADSTLARNVSVNPRQAQAAAQATQREVQAARNANAVRVSDTYESIPASVRNNPSFRWFFDFDTNNDGQLSMPEYVNGCNNGIWTKEIAEEFSMLDRNGDGLVTVDEALLAVKEWDEERARLMLESGEMPAVSPAGRPQPSGATSRAPTAANTNVNTTRTAPTASVPANNNQGQGNRQPTAVGGGSATGRAPGGGAMATGPATGGSAGAGRGAGGGNVPGAGTGAGRGAGAGNAPGGGATGRGAGRGAGGG